MARKMNLIIGSTSQLAHYFPEDYVKISSRNIDFDYIKNNKWDSVYITFAEQRIYEIGIDYIGPNYIDTLKIINALINNANKIVCYTSCELWSELFGAITLETQPNFNLSNEYTISKLLLLNKIKELRSINSIYNKVIFIHPFYFNSVYRSDYFLFGKIFDSIINKKKIQVGNLDFDRDMVHAKFVVAKSIDAKQDCLVGSGKLTNAKKFIKDLYELNDLNFLEFVEEGADKPSIKNKMITATVDWNYTYENLLRDTQADILNMRVLNGYNR